MDFSLSVLFKTSKLNNKSFRACYRNQNICIYPLLSCRNSKHHIGILHTCIIKLISSQRCQLHPIQFLFKLIEPDPPTAVIACNNLICSGCMLAAQELKLVIGRDISLVGFDDYPLASMSHPGITVIDRPTTEMGVVASRILLENLNSAEVIAPQNITLPVHLVRRDSVYSLA